MELFIKDLYQDENRRISMNEFKFMIPFIFSFRNVRSHKAMKQTIHDEDYVRFFQNNFQALTSKQKQFSLF